MSALARYFSNIRDSVSTTVEGLKVTTRHLWTVKPTTVLYPEVDVEASLPERYRGFLVNEVEICTGCQLCARACPIDVIYIELEKNEETKERFLTRYDIDLGRCMYCGLCVEPCPTGSIHFTPQFEGARHNLGDLYRRFIDEPLPVYKNPKKPKPVAEESKGEES
ncbi:MAG: NADH-quinone oxidoreductase subunit I [Candidatus Krumholzibacteria bacterium]|jgi:formate hydrogenlyase subunit 6/NADH:ubiquinone oxidoreductase subunit I|nr:NADH-quinone oxidoreductase subunit I [Candidatus Krumholzibacteria bacterium]MDP7021386.1 NADH-quinone oxidoreductase subunit I [Candidatus Krumholzibacteria bacterium]